MSERDDSSEVPEGEGSGQSAGSPAEPPTQAETTVAPSGKRQALRNLRRELTDGELDSPGVQKLLLDDLERADAECEILRAYVERFHGADKRAAILEERLRHTRAIEIMFGVGVGIGGAIIGLAPSFWSEPPRGHIALGIGLLLSVGATVARVVKR